MQISIRNKTHTFNMDVIGGLNKKEFKDHCLQLPIFIQLPKKERNDKINEIYGKLHPNAKPISEPKS